MRYALTCLAVATGCTAAQYDGPRLPRSQVARIGGTNAHVTVIDGDPVHSPYVEVLPGEHQLEVAVDAPMPLGTELVSRHDLTVCFAAYPGRYYEVKPAASVPPVNNHWRPAVFDVRAEVFVEHPCLASKTTNRGKLKMFGPGTSPAADQTFATVSTTADLRTAPSSAAPVAIHLNAGDELIVSKEIRDGWRLVSLPNARVAYVRDAGLLVEEPAGTNKVSTPSNVLRESTTP